jgi:hypothetical protein
MAAADRPQHHAADGGGRHRLGRAEGAVFEDAVLARPATAALLKKLMEERGLKVD